VESAGIHEGQQQYASWREIEAGVYQSWANYYTKFIRAYEREGIPVTTPARTLFDLAELLRPRQLERVFDQAEQLQIFDLRALERVRNRCNGRHALASL